MTPLIRILGGAKLNNFQGSNLFWFKGSTHIGFSNLLHFLQNMADGKSLKMRFVGKYTKTRNLSPNEVKGIKDVLLAYDVLKQGI